MIEAPTKQWKPTPKQAQFLALPYSVSEALYGGAVMAGKSDVLLLYPIIHKLHENPGFKGLYLRRTSPELKNEVIPRSEKFFRKLGAQFNKNEKVWTFPSGALFFFGHCENESDVHIYDSMQINYAAFDELTSFTEWQYLYIALQRVRASKGSGLPAIVRAGSNPGNIGHNWVRRRFIDPFADGQKLIRDDKGNTRIFIPATVKDNPYVTEEYIQKLEALPEAEKQAKLYGKWDAYEGSVFEEFRDKHYPDEPEHALHVVEPFDIPSWWPRIVSIDWGFAPPAMTWIGYGAISPNRKVYIYREQYWQKTKIEDWAAEARVFIDAENPVVVKMCKSAGQDRGQEHTILSQVTQALGRGVELSNNAAGSRVAGKMLLHEYFRWNRKPVPMTDQIPYNEEHAQWIRRNQGQTQYELYLKSYQPRVEETNLPRLQIFGTCKLLINAIKSCAYDKNNPQDVAEFPGDDPYDALRYLVDSCEKFFDDSTGMFKKIQQTDQLIETLNVTQDWTSFYRNARAMEKKSEVPQISYRYARR